MVRAISSALASRVSAILSSRRPRARRHRFHDSKARIAGLTARSTSGAPPRGTSALAALEHPSSGGFEFSSIFPIGYNDVAGYHR
jgi:hypothetical protein